MTEHTREPWTFNEWAETPEDRELLATLGKTGTRRLTNDGAAPITTSGEFGTCVAHVRPIAERTRKTPYDAPDDERDANARRIVACVNSLEGIPTEALEAGVVKELIEALEESKGLIREAQERLCHHLLPDSGDDDAECINDLLYMFDGPEQREIEAKIRAALARTGRG